MEGMSGFISDIGDLTKVLVKPFRAEGAAA